MKSTKSNNESDALRESEQNFRDLVENLQDGVVIADENSYHIYVNPRFSEITGYSRDELLNMTGWDFTRPEDRVKLKQKMKKRMADKPVRTNYDRIIVKKDGTEVPVQMSTTITTWQGKKRPMAVIHDLTDRKRAEEEIRKLSKVVETTPEAVVITDMHGNIKYVNQGLLTLGGFEDDSLIIGRSIFLFSNEEGEKQLKEEIIPTVLSEGKWRGEVPVKRKDSSFFWAEMICSLILDEEGKPKHLLSQYQDITKRRIIENALKESEKKYRLLADNSLDMIWQMDLKLVFTYVSPSIRSIMGYTVDEWVGTSVSQHAVTKDFFNMARKSLYAIKQHKELKHHTFDVVMLCKDGTEIPVEITAKLLFNKKGLPIGFQGTTRDITERIKAEEALRDKEIYTRAIMEQSPISIQIFDKNGLTMDTNKAWGELWQLSSDELIGKYNVLEDEYAREIGGLDDIEKAFKGITTSPFEMEYNPVKSGNPGRKRYIKCVVFPIKNKNGEVNRVVLMHEDVTDKKKTEQELKRHHEHLEELVQERTKELEGKNKKLKHFNELFVGREFRIKELREKVKELEKKVK